FSEHNKVFKREKIDWNVLVKKIDSFYGRVYIDLRRNIFIIEMIKAVHASVITVILTYSTELTIDTLRGKPLAPDITFCPSLIIIQTLQFQHHFYNGKDTERSVAHSVNSETRGSPFSNLRPDTGHVRKHQY
ncbi:11836_t:CDS:2, partial [Dentiscutata erythropus]